MKAAIRCFLVVVLPLSAGAADAVAEASAPALRIEMRPEVSVRGPRVTLGEVATLSSPSLPVLQRAMALPIGPAPKVGDVTVLERERIERWLRARGLSGMAVQWSGALDTAVRTAGHAVAADEIVALARSALLAHLQAATGSLPQAQIELQALALPGEFALPDGSTLAARPLGTAPLGKRMLVWVDALVEGRFVRTVPVRFEVGAYAVVPVAAGPLAAGTVLKASDLEQRRVDIAAFAALAPREAGLSVPAAVRAGEGSLRRAVRPGEPIVASSLQDRPAVARGEWASLVSHQGMVTLESRVEVLQDGRQGQTVRVRQAHATGEVLARVSGPGQLEMQP